MEKLMKSSEVSSSKKHILVFRSNINTQEKASRVCNRLLTIDEITNATIDLNDWENVLRIECDSLIPIDLIVKLVLKQGFDCSELH